MEAPTTAAVSAVIIVADDLIWASRLRAAVDRAGASSVVARDLTDLASRIEREPAAAVLVDLNGRTYDGVEAVQAASDAGRPVIAVGQHEDLELRRRALAAGARRVFSYNKLFSDGPKVVVALLEGKL